jgi:hypothetical protein
MSREFLAGSYDDMVAGISRMLTDGALLSSPAVVDGVIYFAQRIETCTRSLSVLAGSYSFKQYSPSFSSFSGSAVLGYRSTFWQSYIPLFLGRRTI